MADVGALKVRLNLDSAEFSQSMTQVNSKLRGLRSEMNVAKAGGAQFSGSLEGLRTRADILSRTFDAQKIKVAELRRRYEESAKTKGEDAIETQKLQAQYNNAVAAMKRTEDQLKQTTAEIKRQTSPWQKLGERLQDTGERFKRAGDKMKAAGKSLSMKVTAPILGLGTLMVKTGMDFEASMSNVQAVSGATGRDLELLEKKARAMGASTSKSASESADALGYMALAGWNTQQMLDGIEPILRLSEAGNIDLARASDLVTDSMSALQIEVTDLPKYLDMLAQASRKSNTTIDGLMEAFLVAGGTLSSFNVPIEESTALLGLLANRGIKGAQAGTALNAIFTNLTSGAGKAGKALEELGISAFDKATGEFKGLENVLLEIKNKTAEMTEEQQAQYISMIAGKEHLKSFQGLMAGLGAEYGDLKENVIDSNGALNNMAKTMQDNAKGNIAQMKSAIEELSISFSTHILPTVTKGIQLVTKLATKFGEMDPSTKKMIIGFAGAAAAVGPVLVAAGGLTSTIGGVIAVAGKASAAIAGAGGLTAAIAALANPVGITIAAVAALTAGGIAMYKNWDKIMEMSPGMRNAILSAFPPLTIAVASIKGVQNALSDSIEVVDRFSDEVSESTQESMGAFMDLNEKATVELKELFWTSQAVTDEMKEKLVGNFAEMAEQITSELATQKDDAIAMLQEQFSQSLYVSEKEQANILESVVAGYDRRQEEIQRAEEKIQEILQTASEEKRELTEREKQEINRIQENMVSEAIRTMTANELEQKVILERMKENSSELSALQAAEVVQNSVTQKDAVIAEAEQQYNETLAWIIQQRDEVGSITSEQATKMIQDAHHQKTKVIENAEEMHNRVIIEAKAQAGEHINLINWETGEVLSKWEVFKNNTSKKWSEMVSNARTNWGNLGREIKQNVIDAKDNAIRNMNNLAEGAKMAFNLAKNNMIKPVHEARDKIKEAIDRVKSFFTNLKLKFPKIEMPKLPTFSLDGGFSLNPPSVPKLNVSWNARGAYFDKPVVFNSAYGLQGFGEAGGEIAMPAKGKHMFPFADAVAERIGTNNNRTIEKLLLDLIQAVREGKNIIMNDREVGRVIEPYVSEFQQRTKGRRDSFG